MTGGPTVQPVFIFLPRESGEPDAENPVIDPVCGRVLQPRAITGRLLHADAYHYFCSLDCVERFAAERTGFRAR